MKKTGFFVFAIFVLVCVLAVFSCSNMLEDLRRAQEGVTGATPADTPVVTTPPEQIPLTLEAVNNNTTVTFTNKASGDVKYKINDGDLESIASGESAEIQLSAAGDKVSFYGDNAGYGDLWLNSNNSSNIACDEECYVYGNIMSLIKSDGFENERTLTEENTFAYLFCNNDYIKNKPGTELLLPATTLTEYCYFEMFYGCTSLETAPRLPATTLAYGCYEEMFCDCTHLTSAPELPATTLAARCYEEMFKGCTSLTSAPELPAETLAEYCYYGMFGRCTSLTSVPELPATTLAYGCYDGMFGGCTSLISAPELPVMTLAAHCYTGMFRGCTGLTSAPVLPATTLAEYCYQSMFSGCTSLERAPVLDATTLAPYCYFEMFSGCTKLQTAPVLPATMLASHCYEAMFYYCTGLNTVTCLATNISATDCVEDWLRGVPNDGDFYCNSLTDWSRDSNGIPSSWTTHTLPTTPLTLEAVANNTTVTFTNKAAGSVTYIIKGGATGEIPSGQEKSITLSAHQKVSFYGDNARYGASSSSDCSNIGCDEECYVYGNVMSLIKSDGFENERTLTAPYTFACLFYDNANIKNKPGSELLLPATTLAESCYDSMFKGCTGLTGTPELPATTLAEYCYWGMFRGCTSLSSAPELRAMTLAERCYLFMFYGCTSLETVPEDMLPATTLKEYCYSSMFEGCTSLETVPENMLPATTLAAHCYDSMFRDCTSLTSAPALPATTLQPFCYWSMFEGCTSLNTVTCLATDISATNCVTDWLPNNLGTFYRNPSVSDSFWEGKVPNNWNVDPYQQP